MNTTDAHSTPPNFRFLGITNGSYFAGKFVPINDGIYPTALERRVLADARAAKQKAAIAVPTMSLTDRHKLLFNKSHTLTRPQNGDLIRRGLTQAEINDCLSRGWLWAEWGGYGIAAVDPVTGLIVGGQLARDDRSPKYMWLLPGQTHLPETGQNPVAVWESPDFDPTKPAEIRLSEGFLKPLIAAIIAWRSDTQIIYIGAAGGNFQDRSLERVLGALPDGSINLCPDAGAVSNRGVMHSYANLAKLIGPDLRVAWWGQSEKSAPDCDELVGNESIEILTFEQFSQKGNTQQVVNFARPDIVKRLQNRIKRSPSLDIGNDEFTTVANALPTQGIVALYGAKGTAKSKAIGMMIGDDRFLSICHRRSIARDQAAQWDGIFFQDGDRYGSSPLRRDGTVANGVTVVMPSLLGVSKFAGDVLVLDEITALLEFLLSSKLCNRDGIRALLLQEMEARIRAARLVLLADADLGEEAIAWVENIRGENAYLVRSDRKPLGYNVLNMTGTKNEAIAEFLRQAQAVEKGQFLYLNADSKKLIDALEDMLSDMGIKSLKFTQETSGDELQARLIASHGGILPELAINDIRVILSSPSITQGLSLTQNTDSIISRWGIYSGGSISAQDIAQAPDRIRSGAPLYLWVAEKGRAFSQWGRSTNTPEWSREFKALNRTSARLVRQSLAPTTQISIDSLDWQSQNLKMLAAIEVSRNLGMVALRDTVLAHLKLEGKQLQSYAPSIAPNTAKQAGRSMVASSAKLRNEHALAVESAIDRTDDEIKILESKAEKQSLSKDELIEIEKYYLAIFYRLEVVKAVNVLADRGGKTKIQIRNLERVLDSRQAIVHSADSIALNKATPQDWSRAAMQNSLIQKSGAAEFIHGIWSGEILEITDDLINPIVNYIDDNREQFKMAFGWGGGENIGPLKTIGILLDWVGIKRVSHRKRASGVAIRIYSVDTNNLKWLKTLVERRSLPDPHVAIESKLLICGSGILMVENDDYEIVFEEGIHEFEYIPTPIELREWGQVA